MLAGPQKGTNFARALAPRRFYLHAALLQILGKHRNVASLPENVYHSGAWQRV
jgi:hypothetical protein